MRIAIAQTAVEQHRFAENLEHAREFAGRAAEGGAELVVFPEMFLSGFHYGENKKALLAGADFVWEVRSLARGLGIAVAGSVPALDPGMDRPANRMLLASPAGEVWGSYDKLHLFGVFNENRHVHPGRSIEVADAPFAKTGLAVCYDLRFPEMFVKMALRGAELIILSAAWPHPRMEHIRLLARARALECQCFFIFSNQAGVETFGPNAMHYGGCSAAVDPWGKALCECAADAEDLKFCDIDFGLVEKARRQIPALGDRRPDVY